MFCEQTRQQDMGDLQETAMQIGAQIKEVSLHELYKNQIAFTSYASQAAPEFGQIKEIQNSVEALVKFLVFYQYDPPVAGQFHFVTIVTFSDNIVEKGFIFIFKVHVSVLTEQTTHKVIDLTGNHDSVRHGQCSFPLSPFR
jgi:hypothetical protein